MITADGLSTFAPNSFAVVATIPSRSTRRPSLTVTHDYVRRLTIFHLIIAEDKSERFFYRTELSDPRSGNNANFIRQVEEELTKRKPDEVWKELCSFAKENYLLSVVPAEFSRTYEEYLNKSTSQRRFVNDPLSPSYVHSNVQAFFKRVLISNDQLFLRKMEKIQSVRTYSDEKTVLNVILKIYHERLILRKSCLVRVGTIAAKTGISHQRTKQILVNLANNHALYCFEEGRDNLLFSPRIISKQKMLKLIGAFYEVEENGSRENES